MSLKPFGLDPPAGANDQCICLESSFQLDSSSSSDETVLIPLLHVWLTVLVSGPSRRLDLVVTVALITALLTAYISLSSPLDCCICLFYPVQIVSVSLPWKSPSM